MKSKINYENEVELIDSGTFINYGQDKPVTITIKEEDGTSLGIKVKFNYDKSAKEASFNFSQQDTYTLILTVTHNGLIANYGYINPVLVGTFNGHELYFNIRIDINGIEDSPLIHYSWFKGKKIS
ncbi:MAG TPA: hypothetical protein VK164_03205 [Flavobacterium sp.]|uniref:DUF6864 domain-containing function n=1 Tax=Flavobacterium sp. TaxID=239 RepID=UPI002B4AC4AA|nr:hypothetical protein [Flavobacterium sp.]HLO72920.1 hypothetical protein [Flavobacterium sp.]